MNKRDGFDILNDLVFFPNLKQLAICYHERNCEPEDIDDFNSDVLSNVLLCACVNLDSLAIGGLLNDIGANIIAENLKKYNKISGLRLLNCILTEEGLHAILRNGHNLEIVDLSGSLLCSSGEAFARNGCELVQDGILNNLKEVRLSALSNERRGLKDLMHKIVGARVRIVVDGV